MVPSSQQKRSHQLVSFKIGPILPEQFSALKDMGSYFFEGTLYWTKGIEVRHLAGTVKSVFLFGSLAALFVAD